MPSSALIVPGGFLLYLPDCSKGSNKATKSAKMAPKTQNKTINKPTKPIGLLHRWPKIPKFFLHIKRAENAMNKDIQTGDN